MANQLKKLDPFWAFWGEMEVSRGKLIVLSLGSFLVVGVVMLFLTFQVYKLSGTVEYLSKHRIMYGFANEDGVFVSVDERPRAMVMNFAEKTVNNLYTFDQSSVEQNFKEVLSRYDSRVAPGIKPKLLSLAESNRRDGITQSYIRRQHRLEEIDNGYRYITQGIKYEYAAKIQTDRQPIQIEVILSKVPPTSVRYAGIAVYEIKDKPLK